MEQRSPTLHRIGHHETPLLWRDGFYHSVARYVLLLCNSLSILVNAFATDDTSSNATTSPCQRPRTRRLAEPFSELRSRQKPPSCPRGPQDWGVSCPRAGKHHPQLLRAWNRLSERPLSQVAPRGGHIQPRIQPREDRPFSCRSAPTIPHGVGKAGARYRHRVSPRNMLSFSRHESKIPWRFYEVHLLRDAGIQQAPPPRPG